MASNSVVECLIVNQDAERNRRFESCLASSVLAMTVKNLLACIS